MQLAGRDFIVEDRQPRQRKRHRHGEDVALDPASMFTANVGLLRMCSNEQTVESFEKGLAVAELPGMEVVPALAGLTA